MTGSRAEPGGRVVNILNVAALPPADTLEPNNFSATEYQMQLQTTAPTGFGPLVDLRPLAVGNSTEVGVVIRILVPSLLQANWQEQTEWFVRFGDWPLDPDCGAKLNKWPCANGATATVARTDATTWVLEAPATEAVCLIEAVRSPKSGKVTMTQRGPIFFPFRMTLTLLAP